MKHRKCGGSMKAIQKLPHKVVYQCDSCGKVLTMYRRIATSGNQGVKNERKANR